MRYLIWIFLVVGCLALPSLGLAKSRNKVVQAKTAAVESATSVADSSSHMVMRFNRKTLREENVLVSTDGQTISDVAAVPAPSAEPQLRPDILETPSDPVSLPETVVSSVKPTSPADSARSSSRGSATIIVTDSHTTRTSPGNSKHSLTGTLVRSVIDTTAKATSDLAAEGSDLMHGLARLTAYWAGEGDYYTGHRVSSTGIHLHGGHCAVDPSIIPYGSVVEIPGFGQFLAVDTGSAVVSRTAARRAGHTRAERSALVIDLFFERRREGERFEKENPKFVAINWWTPASNDRQAHAGLSEEEWHKIYSKRTPLASL